MGLLWSGEIASAAEADAPYSIWGEIYAGVSRTNNTVTVTGFYVRHRTTAGGANWDSPWYTDAYINGGQVFNDVQTKPTTGIGVVIGTTWYSSTSTNSSGIGVGTGGGSIGVSANWLSIYYGDSSGQQGASVAYPAAGSPSGTTGAPYSIATTSIKIKNDVTNWGTYCTAGSVRSYRADNSGFSGQTYIGTTDNAEVNHTGLTSNDEYWFRGWMSNGAGLSNYQGSTRTAVTLPLAPVASTPSSIKSNKVTIPTTIDTGGGKYPITKQYRIKETAGSYGSWTTYTGDDLTITSLSPKTDYTVELQSVTTAGTTVGTTTNFITKTASGNFLPLMMG